MPCAAVSSLLVINNVPYTLRRNLDVNPGQSIESKALVVTLSGLILNLSLNVECSAQEKETAILCFYDFHWDARWNGFMMNCSGMMKITFSFLKFGKNNLWHDAQNAADNHQNLWITWWLAVFSRFRMSSKFAPNASHENCVYVFQTNPNQILAFILPTIFCTRWIPAPSSGNRCPQ